VNGIATHQDSYGAEPEMVNVVELTFLRRLKSEYRISNTEYRISKEG
jgi:hypothetical protein